MQEPFFWPKFQKREKNKSINSSTVNAINNKENKRKYLKPFDKSIKAITRVCVITKKRLCETAFED